MADTMTIRKWFWIWDIDKEEKWLNSMASTGWTLKSVGFATYTFEKTECGKYIVRSEMHNPDPDYIAFMEETGAEYIGRMARCIFFKRKAELGQFNIYSDLDSKIDSVKAIAKLLTILCAMNLVIGIINSLNHTSIGWINLLFACVMCYGLGKVNSKKENLIKERELHE